MTFDNYYEDFKISMERVILAEDIQISGEPKPVTGKFFFPALTPSAGGGSPSNNTKIAPSTNNIEGSSLTVGQYSSSNYITLEIPIYMQLDFGFSTKFITDSYYLDEPKRHYYPNHHHEVKEVKFRPFKIPKGTEFIVGGLIGSTKFEHLKIIGIWKRV